MRVSRGKTKICWYNASEWNGHTWLLKQTLGTTRRTKRATKAKRTTWDPTKNKNHYGKQLDNGCLRYLHYYPERKSFVRIPELNLHAQEPSCSKSEWNEIYYSIDRINMEKQLTNKTLWDYKLNYRLNQLLIS